MVSEFLSGLKQFVDFRHKMNNSYFTQYVSLHAAMETCWNAVTSSRQLQGDAGILETK